METYPKVRRGEPVAGGDSRGRSSVGVEGVDVGQECTHHRGNPWTHVLGRQAREVAASVIIITYNLTKILAPKI